MCEQHSRADGKMRRSVGTRMDSTEAFYAMQLLLKCHMYLSIMQWDVEINRGCMTGPQDSFKRLLQIQCYNPHRTLLLYSGCCRV